MNQKTDFMSLLSQAANHAETRLNARFAREGYSELTSIRYTVLGIILDGHETPNGGVMPSTIADQTGRVRHNITTLIDRMKADGLVEVRPNENDRRSVLIFPTPKARFLHEKGSQIVRTMNQLLLIDATAGQKNTFVKICEKIIKVN